jgi:plastocyanin
MLRTKAALLGAALTVILPAAAPELTSAGETAVGAAARSASVKIANFNFTPPSLVVEPGTTVTWTNADDSPHTVMEKDRKFKSAALDTDDAFSQTFTAPGEYEYICSIHPRMFGKIVVKPGRQMSSNRGL